jgi:hypothetical protein
MVLVRRIPVQRLVVGEGRQPTVTELKKLCVLYFCELADPLQNLAQGYEYSNFKVSLTYVDEENETIVLSTDVELLEALRFSSVPSDVIGLRFLRITAVVEPYDRFTASSSNVASGNLPSRTIHPLSDDQEPGTTAASQVALGRLKQGRMEHKYTASIDNSTKSEDEFSGEKASESQDEGREEQLNDAREKEHNLCNTNEISKEENEMRKEQKECPQNIASISPLITSTTTQPLIPSTAFFTGVEQRESTGYDDRNTVEDSKSATVTPVEVVSSIIQKAGHLLSHIQIPLDQMEETFKPKISNTLSAVKCCIGTDKAEDKNENSTTLPLPLPLPLEVQNSPRAEHGNASPAARKVCEHPFEAFISLAQKAEKFVQGMQSSPSERQINNREKNQPSMKRIEPHLKPLPDDCNESICCSGFDPNFIHARHQCDLCRCIPIIGFRWHAICPPLTPNISVSTMRRFANFDLCHSCYINFRENLDDCSRTFEIPAEMRFHPVQYGEEISMDKKRCNFIEACCNT